MSRNDLKQGRSIKMPEKSGEELASAVARALRGSGPATQSSAGSSDVLGKEDDLREKMKVGSVETNTGIRRLQDKIETTSAGASVDLEVPGVAGSAIKSGSSAGPLKFVATSVVQPSPYQTRTDFAEIVLISIDKMQ